MFSIIKSSALRLISMLRVSKNGLLRRTAARLLRRTLSQSGKSGWKADNLREFVETVRLGNGSTMEFKVGHMARFTSGSVVLSHNDNAILSTVVVKPRVDSDGDPPLPTSDLQMGVEFRQSAAAMGRIPTNYFRREMNMSDQDVITSRVIDRSLRPSFPAYYNVPTQIVCKPLALDETGDSAILGVNVASAALAVSPIPMRCTVAATRVCIIDGNFQINPPTEQLKSATFNMVMSGTGTIEFNRIFMIDMDGCEISAEVFLEGIRLGLIEVGRVTAAIYRLAEAVDRKKIDCIEVEPNAVAQTLFDERFKSTVVDIFSDYSHDKQSRDTALSLIRADYLKAATNEQLSPATANAYFTHFTKLVMRAEMLKARKRCDGRDFDEVRPINVQVDVYKRLHGSAIFQRGQSQVFATTTFDSPQTAFHPDGIAQMLGAQRQKKFMLHYEFPPLAVNELGSSSGGGNRREIGHGMLAEKALKHVIPKDFPYTIRVATQVLESNGSTSMAAACAGSLALFDAGVPLSGAVGGIAVGLIQEQDRLENTSDANKTDYVLLTDLFGMEDYLGDMDFKMAGTSKGFTAMQMDLKVCGVSQGRLRKALNAGRAGIDHVLNRMNEALAKPRDAFKPSVPIMETWTMPSHLRLAILFRRGAYNAKLVESETGVQVTADEENTVLLLAPNREKLEKAKELIQILLSEKNDIELDFGAYYKAEIVEVMEHGIMVTVKKGTRPMFIHNMQLSNRKVAHASALDMQVGSEITVRYFGRDQNGFHRLSGKMLDNPKIAVQNRLPRRPATQTTTTAKKSDDTGTAG